MQAKLILLPVLLIACAGCNSAPPPDTNAQDQTDIKALEDAFSAAVRARDVNAIMALYTPDPAMVVFDVSTPLQYTGSDAYRKDWQDFLTQFPGPVDISVSNLDITTGGTIAYSHSIQHVTEVNKDGKKTEMTVRVTDGYKKVNGHWLIAHEHVSVPVDFTAMKPDTNAK